MPALPDLKSPAKLNLFLHVTGRRTDGYHLLQSVFVPIDWCDTLHIETRNDGKLRRHDLGTALPTEDLCLRAAYLLQRTTGCTQGADIHIDKHIPWGAGMGGGSSNAATVLKALNQLWGLHLPEPHLADMALKLGADVPFFMAGRPAWVEGVGELITPIALPLDLFETPIAVLKPPGAIPTPAIFASPTLKRDSEHAIVSIFLAAPKRFGRNDLQPPAMVHSREVVQALEIMQGRFGNSRMTGSGSAVFSWVEPGQAGKASELASFSPANVGLIDHTWAGRLCRVLPSL